jgi:restriction system protein
MLASGRYPLFNNRVGWAALNLGKAGLITIPSRGVRQISEAGIEVLKENPQRIGLRYLERFPAYLDWKASFGEKQRENQHEEPSGETPQEMLEETYQKIRTELASQLLTSIHDSSPSFFERLVVDVLVRMGYGGTRKDAGEAVGRAGDNGIDGIIKEDRLGLDAIYIQAKRWENPVGPGVIREFAGALQEKHAHKGILITTSTFTKEANEAAKRLGKITLLDGNALVQLMIDYDVGVTPIISYQIKRIDSDYFTEE